MAEAGFFVYLYVLIKQSVICGEIGKKREEIPATIFTYLQLSILTGNLVLA